MKTTIRNTLVNSNEDVLGATTANAVVAEAAARALEDRGLRLLAEDLRDAAQHAHKRAWQATLAVIAATNDQEVVR